MDALIIVFSLDNWKDLEGGFCGDLVHGECHLVGVKDYNFGASLFKNKCNL